MALNMDFYCGKRVLVTGHMGFKGTWLCRMLVNAGAIVTGYSLGLPTLPALYEKAGLQERMKSVIGDVRDMEHLQQTFTESQPELVFHLAAQPIVRDSYSDPVGTYSTNVMGTVHLMECARMTSSVRSVLNVTTDKVYQNREWYWGYRENEPLDGFDPYSNSKSCSELVTHCYINSFFHTSGFPAVSTVRAGNVVGGGDFAKDRIIPDCVRAVLAGEVIQVRNPGSVRPYQHVLEPLKVYLMIAQEQYKERRYAGCYNVGPDECDCVTTGELVNLFCESWGKGAEWVVQEEKRAPHEAGFLKLDCSKLKSTFKWNPKWHIKKCMELTCRFYRTWAADGDVQSEMDREINELEE